MSTRKTGLTLLNRVSRGQVFIHPDRPSEPYRFVRAFDSKTAGYEVDVKPLFVGDSVLSLDYHLEAHLATSTEIKKGKEGKLATQTA